MKVLTNSTLPRTRRELSRSACSAHASARLLPGVALGLLVALQACGSDGANGLAADPFWLQDGGTVSDGSGGADSSQTDIQHGDATDGDATDGDAHNVDTTNIDTTSTGASDAGRAVEEQYFASLQVDRIMTRDPSPFGDAWKESRTTTLGLVKVAWQGDVGTRWLHVCAMHANEVHGSQVTFSSSFLTSIPTSPHPLTRSGTTWTQPAAVDLVGLKPTHTGPMPGLGESSHESVIDGDKDGEPGVTVQVNVSVLGDQKIFVAQRTTWDWTAALAKSGGLTAEPNVKMAQAILGASLSLLVAKTAEKPVGSGVPNTLKWVPVSASLSCGELVKDASTLFGVAWPPG